MDRRRGNKGSSILSWVIAVILITASAAAIGWFAGEGLMALMSRGKAQVDLADYPDGAEEGLAASEEEAADGTAGDIDEGAQQAVEQGAQAIEPPSASVAASPGSGSRTSPFETPPWVSDNLRIVPLAPEGPEADDTEGIAALDSADLEPEPDVGGTEEGPASDAAVPEAVAGGEAAGPVIPNLYKVRVGPYATRQEAASVALELAKLQLPTLIVQGYYVQIGAFGSKSNAENLKDRISGYGFPVSIF